MDDPQEIDLDKQLAWRATEDDFLRENKCIYSTCYRNAETYLNECDIHIIESARGGNDNKFELSRAQWSIRLLLHRQLANHGKLMNKAK